jgi:hypothetical protein
MHFEVSREIQASPNRVWEIVTDKTALLNGSYGVIRLEGDIRAGSRIKLWSDVSPNRAFPLKISTFSPPSRMVWEGGMPFGLFKGTRTFQLTATTRGCTFHMREDYAGLLKGLIGKSIPDLTPSFEKFADALKRQAEGVAG